MTEKRALANGEPAGVKSSRDNSSKKRRKIAHDDVETETTGRSKGTLAKHGGNRSKSKGQEVELATSKREDGAGQLVPAEVEQEKPGNWSISRCRSGRFLNLDPIFTADGKYVILATEDEVQVFAMSTSRIVRTLSTTHGSLGLTGCKLAPGKPELLLGSTRSGEVHCWNWESGMELGSFEKQHPIVTIDVAGESSADTFLFTLCTADNGHREINVDVVSEDGESQSTVALHKSSTPFKDIRVAAGGKVVIAWSENRLLVGYTANSLSQSSIEAVQYTWREVRLPVSATCLDVQVAPPSGTKAGSSMKVDVAVGESGGSILIYNDILNRLVQSENPEAANDLISNRMHWHRKAVKAVRWSKDGNYIISGGLETVLVLWQLDTGRKQFLPHLSSPINNLVVSPIGNAYAIKLADNSVIILSTSELKPVASMSGLQLPLREDILGRPAEGKEGTTVDPQIPAILHPMQPDRLLLAVPSTQLLSDMDSAPKASLLQAFDMRSGQHISRQTLTRTNVSVLNTGPQGTELTTPDVKLVGISEDGDWLATVDEWTQYPEDNKVLRPSAETENAADLNREVFLKFWRWDESVREWQLVTRVDAPHFKQSSRSSRVLDLAVQPEEPGFATVGADAVVRLWGPDRQGRRGTGERKSIRTWRCLQTVVLEKQARPLLLSKEANACLSFSNDGSILAVCWPGTTTSPEVELNLVHLIDSASGTIRTSKDGLFAGTPRGIGFIDRYLVILSDDRLVVWDIVSDEIKTMLRLQTTTTTTTHAQRTHTPFLAVNPRSQTFAIAFPTPSGHDSQLTVFNPTSPTPAAVVVVFQTSLNVVPRTLLADPRTGGYVIIDGAARVQRIESGETSRRLPRGGEKQDVDVDLDLLPGGLGNIFGGGASHHRPAATTTGVSGDGDDEGRGAGGGKSLADIFDAGPSFALPSVDVLFKNVVDLFNGGAAKA